MNSLHEATFPVSFRVLLSYRFSVTVVTKSIFNHAAVSHDFGRTFYRIDLNRVNKTITNHKIGVFCENTTSITSKRALKTANFACFPAAIFLNIQTCCIVGSVKARLHMRFLMRFLMRFERAIFVAIPNRACKPPAISWRFHGDFGAILVAI